MMRKNLRTLLTFLVIIITVLILPDAARSSECTASYQRIADRYHQLDKQSTLTAPDCRALMDAFLTIAEKYPDCHKADDALFMVGALGMEAWNEQSNKIDLDRSLAAFQRLANTYPQSTLADDAMFYRGEIHSVRGEREQAMAAYRKTLEFRGTDMNAKANRRLAELAASAPETAPAATAPAPKTPPAKKPAPGNPQTPMAVADDSVSINGMSDEEMIRRTFGISGEPGPEPAAPAPAVEESRETGETRETPAQTNEDIPPAPVDKPAAPADASVHHARLTGLRYWSSKDYTRVVIELDGEVPYEPPHLLRPDPELGTPPRLYIDFQGTVIAEGMKQDSPDAGCFALPIGDGLLKKARAGQYQPSEARVVLDIERIDHFNAFPLPGDDFRYVIDVYGSPGSLDTADAGGKKAAASGNKETRASKKFPSSKRKVIVVLDAGHGGKDPGAVGPSGTREKDITLAIAKRAKRILESESKNVEVVLTRGDDRYVSLVERTAMANTLGADLFVSIHINAAANSKAEGLETYYLDNTTDRAALRLAAKENFAEDRVMSESRDTMNLILADLITTSKVEDSVPLARTLQSHMVKTLRRQYGGVQDKGVKKAPFWVLTGATMPCALVEISFISSKKEEKRLRTAEYQQAAAEAIAMGVLDYLESYPELTMAGE